MTEYIVLRYQKTVGDAQIAGGAWVAFGQYAARTPRKAVESAMASYPDALDGGGEFTAVPTRSWRPMSVKVETKTALKFS